MTGMSGETGNSFTVINPGQVITAHLAPAPHEMLPEEECVRCGGHCFEVTGEVPASSPPQYRQRCKHCTKERVAIPREPFEYRDWPLR